MVSTGRHHGFESLEEARVLLALDFAGDIVDVVPQPLRLQFGTAGGDRPDHLLACHFWRTSSLATARWKRAWR
jgi:hypothetical protein